MNGFKGVALMLALVGSSAWGQAGDSAATEKPGTAVKQEGGNPKMDSLPMQTFYLTNATQTSDANEVVTAMRNILPGDMRIYLVPSESAIVVRGTQEQLTQAQKVISELDRPKKAYRLTYTITESDGAKRVGTQHFAMVAAPGQRTVLKQGSKVPIATGSYSATGSTGAQTQFTYLDIGMNFDATLDELANGVKLRTKVEQLSIAEQVSGVGTQDPIIRQSSMEGTSLLTLGKPLVLGSIDIPGSTRHLDVEVVVEPVTR